MRLVGVAAIYLLTVAWLTWPLPVHLGSMLSAAEDATRYDALYSAWALSYESRVLTTAPMHLADANIYHPTPHALFYGPTGFGALPLFAPVYLATANPTLATNVLLLGGVALTAAAIHMVAARWTGSALAGLVAAGTLLTTRWMLWEWVPTAPHAAVLFYFPWIILLTSDPAPRRRTLVALAVLAALQCLVDVTYVAPAVLVPLGTVAVGRLLRSARRRAGAGLLAVVVAVGLATLPVLFGHLLVARENPMLWRQTLWHVGEHPLVLPRGLIGWFSPLAIQPVLLGLVGIGAVVRLARRDPITPRAAWQHAALWTIVGALLALTPVVRIGTTNVTTPLGFLEAWLPVLSSIRVPTRLGVAGLMGLSLLAGLAFAECVGRAHDRRGRLLRCAFAGLVLAGAYAQFTRAFPWAFRMPLPSTYPLQATVGEHDALLEVLRAGEGPLLEVPLTRPKPFGHAQAMYRSIFHHRPLLNGYASYYPATFEERMELADKLPDASALAMLREETGLTTVVVHLAECSPSVRQQWLAATAGRSDLEVAGRIGDDLVLTVRPGTSSRVG